jgi:hypothetical protein
LTLGSLQQIGFIKNRWRSLAGVFGGHLAVFQAHSQGQGFLREIFLNYTTLALFRPGIWNTANGRQRRPPATAKTTNE